MASYPVSLLRALPYLNTSSQRVLFTTTIMSVQIRPLQKSDEPAWRNLWSQYNDFYKRTIPEDVTATTFSRFLDEKVRMYSAVAISPSESSTEEQVIGFANWYPHPSTSSIEETVYLHDLFVDPATRNAGTGRKLIEHVYEHASKELGAKSVYWHTQHFNHRAQLLYVKVADKTDFVQYRKDL